MVTPPPVTAETILFRPSKKRKIYRQRAEAEDDESPASTTTMPAPTVAPAQSLDELIASSSTVDAALADLEKAEVEGTAVSVAEVLRLRKLRRPRVGGVEFRAEGHIARDDDGALIVRTEKGGDVQNEAGPAVVRKFAPQTGTVGDVNKHMMAYIDSELAKRRFEGIQAAQKATAISTTSTTGDGFGKGMARGESKKDLDVQRQPATLGKLLEIDLGDEARSRNVERTNKARRRLDGDDVEEESASLGKTGKVRLGKDGKPWRGRKRRGSDDVKRDQLVDEVLRENRLEIYEEPPVESSVVNDDQAADDRIAEAFRKEFMDAVSARQRKKAVPAQPPSRTAAGKKEEEVMKGPKLGGSRSARAAMRETMLKSGKK